MKSIIDYTNLLKSFFAQKQALSDEVVTRAALGAHNLLPVTATQKTTNGVTFVVNSDSTITVSTEAGGATADTTFKVIAGDEFETLPAGQYTLSGCPSGGGISNYILRAQFHDGSTQKILTDNGNGVTETFSTDLNMQSVDSVYIYVPSGKVITTPIVFKPMLRLATDTDPTYQPYAKTNTELTKDDSGLTANAFANGAVNMLPFDLAAIKAANPNGTWSGNVFVRAGVTFTINDDNSISTSGNSSGAYFNYPAYTFKAGRYKLCGCPSGGSGSSYYVQATSSYIDVGNGSEINLSSDTSLSVQIVAASGTNMNGKVFKPMIGLADMPNIDYAHAVPYAKSNKELTDAVEQTNNRYVITELNHAVSVTADGVKTFKELIQALYTATVSWVNSNLTANEWVEFHQLDYNSGGMLFTPKRTALWGKNSVQRIEFVLTNLDSSGNTEIALMVLGEASADFKYVVIASGTYNYSSRNTDVVPSGNVLSVSFKRFTKIAF